MRYLAAGSYIDHKCPFTGNVSIRGRILSGTVKSTKMNRTLIVRRNYLHFIKKYQRCVFTYSLPCKWTSALDIYHSRCSGQTWVHVLHYACLMFSASWLKMWLLFLCRYEKRHSNVAAHVSPCFRVSDGDTVVIGQCRCALEQPADACVMGCN